MFKYDDNTTSRTTEEVPVQLLLQEGGTFSNFTSPDLTNNPFTVLLTPGVGVWEMDGERKLKLKGTHIGYKPSDGKPESYLKFLIHMKLSKRATKVRFCGEVVEFDISDPSLCCRTDKCPICFTGFGFKVLEPGK